MHQSVHPIKVCVMNQKHQWKSEPIIEFSICINFPIEIGVGSQYPKNQSSHCGKDQHSDHGECDISQVIFLLGEFGLYFSDGKELIEENIKIKESNSSNQKIPVCDIS